MTRFKSVLKSFIEKDGPTIVYDKKNMEVVMNVGTFECRVFKLKVVFYVKGLKKNLISISQLCDVGYLILFDCHKETVLDSKNKTMLTALRDNNISML